jgi:hypothetical protein
VNLDPGFNLVVNPLDAGPGLNVVSNLFRNITPSPVQIRVYTLNEATGAYRAQVTYSAIGSVGFGTSPEASAPVPVGTGAFLFNPDAAGTAPRVLTFVGEVMQGSLANPLPTGFSIRGNQVPQAGTAQSFGLPAALTDRYFAFNKTTGQDDTYQYSNPGPNWRKGGVVGLPTLQVGEAFFYFNTGTQRSWDRTFNVNNPS